MDIRNFIPGLLVATAVVSFQPRAADASLPVPYAIVGCIKGGSLWSEGERVGAPLVSRATRSLEGKTIRVEGYLAPSDRFHADAVFLIHDKCRKDLQKSYNLCDPCRTVPDHTRSKAAPRRERGKRIHLPAEAMKDFNWPEPKPGPRMPAIGIE